jgi:hypothetical protein
VIKKDGAEMLVPRAAKFILEIADKIKADLNDLGE